MTIEELKLGSQGSEVEEWQRFLNPGSRRDPSNSKSNEMELRLGSQGLEVEEWQRFLNTFVEAGLLIEPCRLVVDGRFGATTRLLTLAYQIREKILLSPNNGGDGAGIVGPLTQNRALSQGLPSPARAGVPEEPETEPDLEEAVVKSRRTAG